MSSKKPKPTKKEKEWQKKVEEAAKSEKVVSSGKSCKRFGKSASPVIITVRRYK